MSTTTPATRSPNPASAAAQKGNFSGGEINVYLADDDEQFSIVVRDLLHNQPGITVVGSSGSVEKTLTDLSGIQADVVVLDLYMPEGESLEGVPDLRRLCPDIKVLVVTGGGWADQQVASILAGANGFLYKPFTSSDLASAIRIVHSGKAFFDFSALAVALKTPTSIKPASPYVLSSEDRDFLELIRRGLTNTAIAAIWNTGIKAVYQRRFRLTRKLGLHSARDLSCFAKAASNGTGSQL